MASRTLGLLTACCLLLGPGGCARWGFDPPVDDGFDGGFDGSSDGGQDGGPDADQDGGCNQDTDCQAGQVCDQGTCVDAGGGPGDPCDENADCGLALVCADGTCHPTCATDADCDPGTCQAGVCRGADSGQACLADAGCEPPGVCVDGWCREPCQQSSDCSPDRCEDGLCTDVPYDGCRGFVHLRDDFEDDLVGAVWEQWTTGGAVVGESGGRLALSPSAAGACEAGVRSRRLFDLTASQVTVEVATMLNPGVDAGFMFSLDHPLPRQDRLVFKQWGGTLSTYWTLDGSTTFGFQQAWDPVAHRFLRISEEGGDAVWSVSADGQAFTELSRQSLGGFPFKDLRMDLHAGSLGPTSAPGAVRLESVNSTRLPPSAGGLEVCPTRSIQDSFDESLLRPLWDWAYAEPGTSYMAGGGVMTLIPAANQTGYAGLLTGDTFDLRDGAIWVTMVEATADDPSADTEFGVMRDGRDNIIKISKTGTDLRFWSVLDNQPTLHRSIPFNPVDHRHWRLRHVNGDIHWETSPDMVIWTEQVQAASPFDLGEVHVFMQAGTFDPVAQPGQAVFDNFNVPTM